MDTMPQTKIQKRAQWALDAAIASASHERGIRWRLEEITLHFGGPDGVYAGEGNDGIECAATGNWNTVTEYNVEMKQRVTVPGGDLPARLLKVLEKLGVECEWSDEWTTCCECGRLLRTNPDSWGFRPYFQETDDGAVCFDCEPEHPFPDTRRWLDDEGACRSGKEFVGKRTLAEAVLDPDATDEHLQFVWDKLERSGDVEGRDRTRAILAAACEKLGI